MNNIYIDWKYNKQTILTTKEKDFHCNINEVKIWLEKDLVKFSLLSKTDRNRQTFEFKPIKGINNLEIYIRTTYKPNGWKQHKIYLPEE
jgi:hypothetical protein